MALLKPGAFVHAAEGIVRAWKTQPNLRVQAALGLAAAVVFAVLRVGTLWSALLIASIALVLSLELLNTAIEAVVDLVSPQRHPLAKIAKDTAAGAVLVAAAGALGIGVTGVWAALTR